MVVLLFPQIQMAIPLKSRLRSVGTLEAVVSHRSAMLAWSYGGLLWMIVKFSQVATWFQTTTCHVICREDFVLGEDPSETFAFIFCSSLPDELGLKAAVGAYKLGTVCWFCRILSIARPFPPHIIRDLWQQMHILQTNPNKSCKRIQCKEEKLLGCIGPNWDSFLFRRWIALLQRELCIVILTCRPRRLPMVFFFFFWFLCWGS